MNIRRVFALVGFTTALMLMFAWLYLALSPRFKQPGAYHYEFWTGDNTEFRVKDGEIVVLPGHPGVRVRATPNKDTYDAIIVGGLFLVAAGACACLLASTRPTKPVPPAPHAGCREAAS